MAWIKAHGDRIGTLGALLLVALLHLLQVLLDFETKSLRDTRDILTKVRSVSCM